MWFFRMLDSIGRLIDGRVRKPIEIDSRKYEDPYQRSMVDVLSKYELVGFNYQYDTESSSYIDLTLVPFDAADSVRRFRFLDPKEIKLCPGFCRCSSLVINDVSSHQLKGIRVEVDDYEFGEIHFWASKMIDLDDEQAISSCDLV